MSNASTQEPSVESERATPGIFRTPLSYPAYFVLVLFGMLWIFGAEVLPPFAEVLPYEQWSGAAASWADFAQLASRHPAPMTIGFVLLSWMCYFANRASFAMTWKRSHIDAMNCVVLIPMAITIGLAAWGVYDLTALLQVR